jgi:hypothetical protein
LAFMEQQAVKLPELRRLVQTHGLETKWAEFERNDLRGSTNQSSRTTKDDRRGYLRKLPATTKARVIEELREAGEFLRKARRNDV